MKSNKENRPAALPLPLQPLVSIFDAKTQTFGPPQPCDSLDQAVRSFHQAINTPNTTFSEYPEDFILFHVADWDRTKGDTLTRTHASLALGIHMKNQNTTLKEVAS